MSASLFLLSILGTPGFLLFFFFLKWCLRQNPGPCKPLSTNYIFIAFHLYLGPVLFCFETGSHVIQADLILYS